MLIAHSRHDLPQSENHHANRSVELVWQRHQGKHGKSTTSSQPKTCIIVLSIKKQNNQVVVRSVPRHFIPVFLQVGGTRSRVYREKACFSAPALENIYGTPPILLRQNKIDMTGRTTHRAA